MKRLPWEVVVGAGLGVAAYLWQNGQSPVPAFLAVALAVALWATPAGQAFLTGILPWATGEEPATSVTFADIGGLESAKRELMEALAFLRDPEGARRLGVRPLKGVLLVGPPGTGKTLLAKAAAHHTQSAFVAAAGSEFVEVYAGVGARRVRELFSRARRLARRQGRTSAVVFLDELEVLGGRRGRTEGHVEYDQTLNQLLVEMDGLGRQQDADITVLVLGATNRPDLLDPALLRPGRLDRVVRVDLPDREARRQILERKVRGVALAPDVDLDALAQETFGLSGAHLESVVNEAAILALRQGSPVVAARHLAEAVEKVTLGERLERTPSPAQRWRVAVHESGHALVAETLRPGSVAAVTITSRGNALGYVRQAPAEDTYLRTREELAADLAVALAGYAAEVLVLGSGSTGAEQDLAQAAELARTMVRSGMSRLGLVAEATLAPGELDRAVREILALEEERVRRLLAAQQETLVRVAQTVLERERLPGEELRRLAKGGGKAWERAV
jgi:cell division protease FtsH